MERFNLRFYVNKWGKQEVLSGFWKRSSSNHQVDFNYFPHEFINHQQGFLGLEKFLTAWLPHVWKRIQMNSKSTSFQILLAFHKMFFMFSVFVQFEGSKHPIENVHNFTMCLRSLKVNGIKTFLGIEGEDLVQIHWIAFYILFLEHPRLIAA